LCPFLPAGRQGPCLSRFGGTGHVPARGDILMDNPKAERADRRFSLQQEW